MIEPEIIEFLKQNGPSTPAQFAKHANITLLFASAMLGDVASKGLAKTSHLKIGGGSPLYYLEEQRDRLQNFSNRLGSKERHIYEELKTKKVLRENELNPLARLSLRAIKDFSFPIRVKISGTEEIFWRWYLLDQKEAEKIIRDQIARKDAELSEHEDEAVVEKKEVQKELLQITKDSTETAPIAIKNNGEVEKKNSSSIQKENLEKDIRERKKDEIISKEKNTEKVITEPNQAMPARDTKSMVESPDLSTELASKFTSANSNKIISLFKERGITITKYDIIKKNKEYTLIISVPSCIGRINCYAKIIDKKKITDGEVALFIVETQNKGMPGAIIASNESIKKIEDKFNKDFNSINLITFQ